MLCSHRCARCYAFAAMDVQSRSVFRSDPIPHNYDPTSQGLRLTNTTRDIELETNPPNCIFYASIVTYIEFLEAYLASDGKFAITAYNLEFFQFQGFNQTLIQEGGGLEV